MNKYICIDISNEDTLTLNKIYIEQKNNSISYNKLIDKLIVIINDKGEVKRYHKRKFKLLEDFREDKLNNLLK